MRISPLTGRAVALVGGLTTVGLATAGLAACGGGGSPSAAAPSSPTTLQAPTTLHAPTTMHMPANVAAPTTAPVRTDSVTIRNFAFSPAVISIKVGTTVTWTNRDDEAHTVFFLYDHSNSPVLVNNHNVYRKTFGAPGRFAYHCSIHPFMVGAVVVTR